MKAGGIDQALDHPTNTCDPYTGNWAEHLMDLNHLREILLDEGFEASVLCGYYGSSNRSIRTLIAVLLNTVITLLGRKGLIFANFYMIYGRKWYA